MNNEPNRLRFGVIEWTLVSGIILSLAVVVVLLLARHDPLPSAELAEGSSSEEEPAGSAAASAADQLEAEWGIQAQGFRLALGGNMLDFRYSILDPAKAGAIQKEEYDAYLLDETTGLKLSLPDAARAGSARRSARHLAMGSSYSLNFPNAGRHFQTGDKVTVVMGDFRAEHLTVE